jgi:hypothetical protein
MPLTVHRHEIAYNGRTLAPGEMFTPFPDAHPGYTVTFVGVFDEPSGPRVHLRDAGRAVSVPLADIAPAYTGPFGDDVGHITMTITTEES